MKQVLRVAVSVAVTAFCSTSIAASIGVASFNMAWAGREADFAAHIKVCTSPAVAWCDTRAKPTSGKAEPTQGELERAQRCHAAFDSASGGAAQGQMVAPCNAYGLTATKWKASGSPAIYTEKLAGLRSTVELLIDTQAIGVIAFQEVKSEEVIRAVLGKHADNFEVCVAEHNAFQTVGFAWLKSLAPAGGRCVTENGLAIAEKPKDPTSLRRLRPGLGLELAVGGQKITFMNVHLKSACANLKKSGSFPARVLTDDDQHCRMLNRQVLPLENWIEGVAKTTPNLVLLGDFNRRLDEEAASNAKPSEVRIDKSAPSSPNKPDDNGAVGTRLLWQEISDGNPNLIQVPLASAGTSCRGFTGLDHILVSEALAKKIVGPLMSIKVPVNQSPSQVIQSSDHCPRVTTLTF